MIKFEELERIHVELSSACNAACPSCPRNADGGYTIPWLKQRTMSLADFKLIFDTTVLRQLDSILFCGNFGDPIFCKDLPGILEYINSVNHNVDVKVHTNGGIRLTEWWASLPTKHKKLTVVFSIDGLHDTNHIYRRNVKWDRVMENVAAYIGAGGIATWEFLIFKHNEHQMDLATQIADQMGFRDIQFKRPFGFDDANSNYDAMRVVDSNGNFDYHIYPPSQVDYNNRNVDKQQLNKHRSHAGLPLDAYQESWQVKNDYYDEVVAIEVEKFAHLDDTGISCMTKNNKEVYIDSAGYLHPCCFLGIGGQNVTLAYDSIQYNKWLEDNIELDANNVKLHSLKHIMDSKFLGAIEETWAKTHKDGRMMCCSKMCSKKYSPTERLYIDNR